MKILKLLMLLLVLSSLSCRSQNQQKNNHGRIFDIQKFERYNKKGIFSFVENDTIVNQFKEEFYREYRMSSSQKNYKKLYTYNNNGILLGEATYFLGLLVGKVIGFDVNGSKIRETDYTRPNFKFTVEQLAKKMQKGYALDLYNEDNIELRDDTRLDNEGNPIVEWWVVLKSRNKETTEFESKTYRINGTTGELISVEKGIFGGIN